MATSGVLATYRATRHDDQDVAVTVIDCAEATFVDRFRRESDVLLSLSRSPKIVTVHEAGMTPDGSPYLVLDPSDEALDELVAAEGPMGEAEASRVLADAAEAIADSHLIGVVHRCLGPGAIRRGDDGNFRVANFCVGSLTDATLDRQLEYVAPEARKAGSGHMGAAVDVYSLGATLLHVVTGRDPSDPDALEAVRSGPVRDLIAVAMDFDPARRPSALELQRRLVELSRLETPSSGDAAASPEGDDAVAGPGAVIAGSGGAAGRRQSPAEAGDPGSVDELLAELIQPAATAPNESSSAVQPPPPRPQDRVRSQPSSTADEAVDEVVDEAVDDDPPVPVGIDLESPATPDPAVAIGLPAFLEDEASVEQRSAEGVPTLGAAFVDDLTKDLEALRPPGREAPSFPSETPESDAAPSPAQPTPGPVAENGRPAVTDPPDPPPPDVRVGHEQPPPPIRDAPLDAPPPAPGPVDTVPPATGQVRQASDSPGPVDAEPPATGLVRPAPIDVPSVGGPSVEATVGTGPADAPSVEARPIETAPADAPPVDASWAPPVVEEPSQTRSAVPDPSVVDEAIETVDLADVLDSPAAKAAWDAAVSGASAPPDAAGPPIDGVVHPPARNEAAETRLSSRPAARSHGPGDPTATGPPSVAPHAAAASSAGPSPASMPAAPRHPTMDLPVVRSSIVSRSAPPTAGSLEDVSPIDARHALGPGPTVVADRRIARFDGPRRRRSPAELVDDVMIRVRPLLGLFVGMMAGVVLLAGAYYVLEQRSTPVDDPASSASSTAPSAGGLVVPVVVDLDVDAASTRLENAGFDIAVIWEFDLTRPRGQVLESDPVAGEAAPIGSTVSLVVSRGTEPTCAGSNEAAVRRQLEGRGLKVAGVTRSTNDAIAEGLVVRCLIYDDTETAVIVVSDGPREADG